MSLSKCESYYCIILFDCVPIYCAVQICLLSSLGGFEKYFDMLNWTVYCRISWFFLIDLFYLFILIISFNNLLEKLFLIAVDRMFFFCCFSFSGSQAIAKIRNNKKRIFFFHRFFAVSQIEWRSYQFSRDPLQVIEVTE